MWILSDEAMNRILDGEFDFVVELAKEDNKTTIRDLFFCQNEYKSYNGFRKFYNKYLKPNIDNLDYIEDNSLLPKIIRMVCKVK